VQVVLRWGAAQAVAQTATGHAVAVTRNRQRVVPDVEPRLFVGRQQQVGQGLRRHQVKPRQAGPIDLVQRCRIQALTLEKPGHRHHTCRSRAAVGTLAAHGLQQSFGHVVVRKLEQRRDQLLQRCRPVFSQHIRRRRACTTDHPTPQHRDALLRQRLLKQVRHQLRRLPHTDQLLALFARRDRTAELQQVGAVAAVDPIGVARPTDRAIAQLQVIGGREDLDADRLTEGGKKVIELPSGEVRKFLEDGDEIILRARCNREGFASIGFGECRGTVVAAR